METTAEFEKDQLSAAQVPLRFRPRVTIGCKTDIGCVRENNEDKFEYFLPESEPMLAVRGLAFLVCDGMGGHAAGQIASELACKTFLHAYLNHMSADPVEAARTAVQHANRFVRDAASAIPERRGMGCTLSALLLVQDSAIVVQVGDSRIYRLREGHLDQLTADHTFAEELVRGGFMDRETAERDPRSHVLTRAIGAEDAVDPDIETHDLKAGDVFLLCSDGVTNLVSDDEIAQLLQLPPSQAAWEIVNRALVAGGHDNATAVVVRVDALESSNGASNESG
ncbi:MAG: serine/threonine-protein phosphatase [Armatimonadetes bacterium]|nr:MAG: serine/threonine-protein phosphatase [Armatimonadota bacterium]